MTDPVAAAAARAAAERLAGRYGAGLPGEVEAALYAGDAPQRPSRYFDPVSVAVLIVAVATLAWNIYADQRKKTAAPPADAVERAVRVELRARGDAEPAGQGEIISVVVTEIIRNAGE